MSMTDVREAFNEALLILLRRFISFYFLIKSLRVVYIDKDKIYTFGGIRLRIVAETDGRTIYLYREWLNQDERNRILTLIHELLHVMLLHPFRKMEMVKEKVVKGYRRELLEILANMAIDAKVNFYMTKLGIKVDLPNYFSKHELEKLSAEDLFEKLIEHNPKEIIPPDLLKPTSDFDGIVLNEGKEDLMTVDTVDDLRDKLEKIVAESLIAAKTAGKLSGFEEWILNQLLKSRIHWTILLRRTVAGSLAKNYVQTWTKLNRKSQYFPGYKKITKPLIWCFVDVSGSITYEEFRQFMSEILKASKESGGVILVLWDTEVKDERKIRRLNDLVGVRFKHGGGTTFAPVIAKYVRRIKPHDVMICLTDGMWFDFDNASKLVKQVRATSKILVYTYKDVPGFDVKIKLDVSK